MDRYDFERGEVHRPDGAVIQLTDTESRILETAYRANGRVLTKEFLLDAMYGHLPYADYPDQKIIYLFICKLRRKIKGCSFDVKTVWGRGYQFVGEMAAIPSRIGVCPCCGHVTEEKRAVNQ